VNTVRIRLQKSISAWDFFWKSKQLAEMFSGENGSYNVLGSVQNLRQDQKGVERIFIFHFSIDDNFREILIHNIKQFPFISEDFQLISKLLVCTRYLDSSYNLTPLKSLKYKAGWVSKKLGRETDRFSTILNVYPTMIVLLFFQHLN
jgi:hypothetical protein